VTWRVIEGDALAVLPALGAGSVQTCITSPPYFGLRDYGTASWEGGDPGCDHVEPRGLGGRNGNARGDAGRGRHSSSTFHGSMSTEHGGGKTYFASACGKCGAKRIDRQIGLEPTPDEYVANLVSVFREVRRVLRADGTLWLNVGDSYNTSPKGNPGALSSGLTNNGRNAAQANEHRGGRGLIAGLKPKDLIGVPWMLAFALRADGWYLRQDIIWSKLNPMPESVRDRCTKAHEYLFLLSKSPRYWCDMGAIAEEGAEPAGVKKQMGAIGRAESMGKKPSGNEGEGNGRVLDGTRNKRSVWPVATQPYPGAHFAVMPEKLVEPCVMAGSRPGDLVLDPFAGAGTVGVVADRLERSFVGVELNPEYAEMARRRIAGVSGPLFATQE
jgi:DNA modification methylase